MLKILQARLHQYKNRELPDVHQEATVRTGHATTDWFQIGKGAHQGCILSPCLFKLGQPPFPILVNLLNILKGVLHLCAQWILVCDFLFKTVLGSFC